MITIVRDRLLHRIYPSILLLILIEVSIYRLNNYNLGLLTRM